MNIHAQTVKRAAATESRPWRRGTTLAAQALLACCLAAAQEPPARAPGPNAPADARYLDGWRMAGANPERTSWTPEEVKGDLKPIWYRPIEPYISYKFQIIAADKLLFVSTAGGLYALDPETAEVAWVHPTKMPLGHSPTVVDGVVYVGGYDRRVRALKAAPSPEELKKERDGLKINDRLLWLSEPADAGFETNPLLVEGLVIAGSRDGILYAFDAGTGRTAWKFQTGGPVLFSAAYKDGTVYFASNDSHAYAVRAADGALVWKSEKLPGAGFHAYWPTVYKEYVIFGGGEHYTQDPTIGVSSLNNTLDNTDIYDCKDEPVGPEGREPYDWAEGTTTLDAGRITEYYENKPWRRTCFVLERATGAEFTFDSDGDGKPEYAPFTWHGTHSGNRFPAVVAGNGVVYICTSWKGNQWIPRAGPFGWKFGTKFIGKVGIGWATDEPEGLSVGGNVLYVIHSEAGDDAFFQSADLSTPGPLRWNMYGPYLRKTCPGYDSLYSKSAYKGGVYAKHGHQVGPVPYRGKVYQHAAQSIIAWGRDVPARGLLEPVPPVESEETLPEVPREKLKEKLAAELEKTIAAGHLRPGYYSTNLGENHMSQAQWGHLTHYFHNPAETLRVLCRALPHLAPETRERVKTYLQEEYANHGEFVHAGWRNGASREAFDTPPEVAERMAAFGPLQSYHGDPMDLLYRYYGLWKYAEVFGGASEILAKNRLMGIVPTTLEALRERPFIHNALIAGYTGFLALLEMAGEDEPEEIRNELRRLLALRAETFETELFYKWETPLKIGANFMFLTPELAAYLRAHSPPAYDEDELEDLLTDFDLQSLDSSIKSGQATAGTTGGDDEDVKQAKQLIIERYKRAHVPALQKAREAVEICADIAPYWFVSKYDCTYGEGALQVLFDYHAVFQAKAMILKDSYGELARHIDVPAFAVGDLFYMDNLCACLEASDDP